MNRLSPRLLLFFLLFLVVKKLNSWIVRIRFSKVLGIRKKESLRIAASPYSLSLQNLQAHQDYKLLSASSNTFVSLSNLIPISSSSKEERELVYDGQSSDPIKGTLLLFLTHLADLSSFELAQQLNYYLPQLEALPSSQESTERLQILCIAPGASLRNAQQFSSLTNFPLRYLYLDTSGALYRGLGFNRGVFSDVSMASPYLKLLPMLVGIGSPGTIPEVLRGYLVLNRWIQLSL